MDTRNFVALTIFAEGGEIQGKTKLQKLVYFIGVLSGSVEELGYRAHFYGPYSDDVANAVSQLKATGVLDQNVSDWGFNRSGFEVKRYDFRLTDAGEAYCKDIAECDSDGWKHIEDAVKKYRTAGERDYMALAIAAKTYFILGKHEAKQSKEDLVDRAKKFGWTVKPHHIEDGAEYLHELGLVEFVD